LFIRIENQSGYNQEEDHHQIEFTMFDDLIELVTGKYQKWSDARNLTPADLADLLDDCENIEELKQKLSQNREQTSLWEDVFSSYFDDPKGWKELEGNIEDTVIPIRNRVMHHRRIRIHHLRQLKESRDELNQIIGTAKPKLPQPDLNEAFKSLRTIVENASSQFALDPEIIERLEKSARIDPEIIKALSRPPLIDPEIMRRITSGINFRIQGFDKEPTSDERNEEDSNGDENDNQNEEDKPDDNDENDKGDKDDSSEDDTNGDNDKS